MSEILKDKDEKVTEEVAGISLENKAPAVVAFDSDKGKLLSRDDCQSNSEGIASTQITNITDAFKYCLKLNATNDTEENSLNMTGLFSNQLSTSPGTLQDVTMENSYGTGCRSPLGFQQCQSTLSPTHPGRSIREFEEQMETLRNENFNLKLRLYFFDEATGFNSDECKKDFVDLKVEIEILRKEIREKQELLKEAAMAMTQMENEKKAVTEKSEAIIENLNERIQYLEMVRDGEKKQNVDLVEGVMLPPPLPPPSDNPQKERGLEDLMKYSQEKVNAFQKRISELEDIVRTRDDTVLEYEAKVKELAFTNGELVESLDRKDKEIASTELQTTRQNLEKHKMQLADTRCMLQDVEEQLAERNCLYEKACLVIQKLMLNSKRKGENVKRIEEIFSPNPSDGRRETRQKSGSANDLLRFEEDTRLCRSTSDSEMMMTPGQKCVSSQEKLKAQEAEIEQLKAELKKRTINLQNLINKELWEKNREIERLTRLVNERKQCLSPTSPRKEPPPTNAVLAQSFTEKEYLRAIEQNKELQNKVDVLIQRLSSTDQSSDALISRLRSELQEARQEVDNSEKWRRECTDICSILSNRLDELGGFLNSLLQHKDVLGFLGADRRKAMRKAVDRSLDLSKSLNMTLSCSMGASTLEQSVLQLSNLSGMLLNFHHNDDDNDDGDDNNDNNNRTVNSNETLNRQQQQSIATLTAENTALKRELDKRRCSELLKRERRALPIGLVTVENHSESEAWSEPDRKVSLARIGLEEHHTPAVATATTTMGAVNAIKQPQLTLSDSDSETLNQSRSATKSLRNNSERIAQLEQLVAQRDERILDIQCQLVDTDNRLKKEHLRVIELTKEVEQWRRVDGERGHENVDRFMQSIEENTIAMQRLQKERDQLEAEVQMAKTEIAQLKKDAKLMQKQYDVGQVQARQRLVKLRCDLNALLEERLSEQERRHKRTLEHDWIARVLYEERQQQLENVQRRWKEAQNMIESFTDNEKELKQSLVDNELEKRSMQKQLDESTLQASKAIMERTKALNENLLLERQITQLRAQIHAQDDCQRCLQNKIEQLQGIQMALQQQIVTQQRAPRKQQYNASDDVSHSGYTSEDVPMAQAAPANVTDDQRPNNLSPDLGIESDAAAGGGGGGGGDGRLSGGEQLINIAVPCLNLMMKAAEEHANTSDAKDENNHNVIKMMTTTSHSGGGGGGGAVAAAVVATASAAGNNIQTTFVHDCVKVDQENIKLRRELNRTQRALEETCQRLRVSNERKAQIEKDIKTQIRKTHDVLKNVRENLEGEK